MVDGWVCKGSFWGSGKLRERARRPYSPTLHCVDSFGSDDWKAKDFEATARHLGLDGVINLHTSDWAAWEASLPPDFEIDFLWWDGFDPKAFAPWWDLALGASTRKRTKMAISSTRTPIFTTKMEKDRISIFGRRFL